MVATGRIALRQWFEDRSAAVPDARLEVVSLVETDEQAAAEIVVRGAHTGRWAGAPPSGEEIELPVAVVCTIHGGLISSVRLYYDLATLLQEVRAL